jgi:hypothetical protein
MHDLPPSVTVSPTTVGVSVLAGNGVTVQVSFPRPRGLHDLPEQEIVEKAHRWATNALRNAAETLEHA